MKRKLILLVFVFPSFCFSQTKDESNPEIRLGFVFGKSGPTGTYYEISKTEGGLRTSFARGIDLKMVFPTNYKHLSLMASTFFIEGGESNGVSTLEGQYYNNQILGGAICIGPMLSVRIKKFNFETYLTSGYFCFMDELTSSKAGNIVFSSVSNYSAPGIKSGFNIQILWNHFNINAGGGIFTTSGKESTLFFKTVDIALGYAF